MKKTRIITTFICLLPVAAGILLYPSLPDVITTHWDIHGNPNGWEPKFVGVIVFPCLLVVLNLLMPLLLRVDPRYINAGPKTKKLLQWIIPPASLFCGGSTLVSGLGYDCLIGITAPVFLIIILVFVGYIIYLNRRGE